MICWHTGLVPDDPLPSSSIRWHKATTARVVSPYLLCRPFMRSINRASSAGVLQTRVFSCVPSDGDTHTYTRKGDQPIKHVQLLLQLPSDVQSAGAPDRRLHIPSRGVHVHVLVRAEEPAPGTRRLPRRRGAAPDAPEPASCRSEMVATLRRHLQHVHGLATRHHPQQCQRHARVFRQPERRVRRPALELLPQADEEQR